MRLTLQMNAWYLGCILLFVPVVSGAQRLAADAKATAINPELVTPEPIENAKRLYDFLRDTYRRKIISGVMTLNSMDEVNWLKQNTGKEPALLGLDFMHCGRDYNWYNDLEPINDARTYYNRNGIPIFAWHWRDPLRKTEEFYTDKTTFDVSKINDPASAEYQAMISDIDYISSLLKVLHDEGIPVIWRPLHEAAGGWFWWGAKGAQPCKKLFQVMYDRMVNHHGLKNLIWVWTREPNDAAWYPGDEYVDIVGRDLYKDGDHSSHIGEYNTMVNLYADKKMITLSEVGSFPDVDNLVKDNAGWLWYMPWYGKYTRESTYNSLDLWKKMFAHSYVLTLDEMPDLRTYESIITDVEHMNEKDFFEAFPTVVFDNRVGIRSSRVIGQVTVTDSVGRRISSHHIEGRDGVVEIKGTPGLYLIKNDRNEVLKVILR